MAINEINGRSVYCSTPIETRQNEPHYRALRELVVRYSKTNNVAELGGGDLPITGPLTSQGYTVYNFEYSQAALIEAKAAFDQAIQIRADVTQLPLSPQDPTTGIDTIVAGDLIEHLTNQEAVDLLSFLRQNIPQVTLIVSMPDLNPLHITTIKELTAMAIHRRRPESGQFDKTHQLFMSASQQVRFFTQQGWDCLQTYYSTWHGVLGLTYDSAPVPKANRRCHTPLTSLACDIIPRILSPFNAPLRGQIAETLTTSQAIQVLTPHRS